jgi:hypothetical protein
VNEKIEITARSTHHLNPKNEMLSNDFNCTTDLSNKELEQREKKKKPSRRRSFCDFRRKKNNASIYIILSSIIIIVYQSINIVDQCEYHAIYAWII